MRPRSRDAGGPVAAEVEAFLRAQPDDVRAALLALRRVIAAAAPDAVETLSYGVPAFKYRGRPLVSYGAAKDHCSFYVQSPAVMDGHRQLLTGLDTTKGTIHFEPDAPLPVDLVASLVRARMAETDATRSR
jgi:uncharacterized protein YdhG (YjbR/CyaY superfamily)